MGLGAREQRALAEEWGRRGGAQEAELREQRRQPGESAGEMSQLRGQLEVLRGQVDDLRENRARLEAERDKARAAVREAQTTSRLIGRVSLGMLGYAAWP